MKERINEILNTVKDEYFTVEATAGEHDQAEFIRSVAESFTIGEMVTVDAVSKALRQINTTNDDENIRAAICSAAELEMMNGDIRFRVPQNYFETNVLHLP